MSLSALEVHGDPDVHPPSKVYRGNVIRLDYVHVTLKGAVRA